MAEREMCNICGVPVSKIEDNVCQDCPGDGTYCTMEPDMIIEKRVYDYAARHRLLQFGQPMTFSARYVRECFEILYFVFSIRQSKEALWNTMGSSPTKALNLLSTTSILGAPARSSVRMVVSSVILAGTFLWLRIEHKVLNERKTFLESASIFTAPISMMSSYGPNPVVSMSATMNTLVSAIKDSTSSAFLTGNSTLDVLMGIAYPPLCYIP